MNFFNLLKINWKSISIFVLLVINISTLFYIKLSYSFFEKWYETEKKLLGQKKQENLQYAYIEDILKEYKSGIDKYKTINQPDLFSFWEELKKIVLNWILIENREISLENWFKLDWLAPNMRTIDLQVYIFNTYNKLFWGFTWPVSLSNVNSKNWIYQFTIIWSINEQAILNKIFSDDIDWDWKKDYELVEVKNNVWINQKKVILIDKCPFTPKINLIVKELIKNNKDISDVYPYYKSLNDKWYFELNEEWCLKSWDIKINN